MLVFSIGAAVLALWITYLVIYFAVRNALRAHARWQSNGGVAAEDSRHLQRATR